MFVIYGLFDVNTFKKHKITKIRRIKFKKRLTNISHVFVEIAHDIILKLNIVLGRQPARQPPFSNSLAAPLVCLLFGGPKFVHIDTVFCDVRVGISIIYQAGDTGHRRVAGKPMLLQKSVGPYHHIRLTSLERHSNKRSLGGNRWGGHGTVSRYFYLINEERLPHPQIHNKEQTKKEKRILLKFRPSWNFHSETTT